MKKYLLVFSFILFVWSISAQNYETINGKQFIVHQVVKGNTLYSIAREYNVNMSDILNNNPDAESGIKIGQSIYIPVFDQKDEVEVKEQPQKINQPISNTTNEDSLSLKKFHIVEKQETLYSISKYYEITIYDLVRVNPGIESGIQIGQRIIIPDENNQSSGSKYLDIIYYDTVISHPIAKSETLYSISKRYMVSQAEIKAYNGMKNNNLQPNAVLYIPLKKENLEPIKIREIPQITLDTARIKNEFIYHKKDSYQIVLALPLGLSNPAEKFKSIATEFYMGVEYALDSLRKLGLNADVHVIDCSVGQEKYLSELKKFTKADLIIGPFTGDLVDKTAQFSTEHQIKMINPLIGYGQPIQNNPYLINAMTSDITLVKGMAKYVAKHETDRKIILVKTSEKDQPLYNAFRETLFTNNSETKVKFIEATVSEMPTYFAKGGDYAIIYLSRNQNEVKNVLNTIQKNANKVGKGDIAVYGTKEWTNMNEVKDYYLNTYHYHFPMANAFNYDDEKTIQLLRGIRTKYNTDLTKFMAQGFDVTYYFLSKYCFNKNVAELIMNDFKLIQYSEGAGVVNTTTYIYEQKDFEYVLLKKMD